MERRTATVCCNFHTQKSDEAVELVTRQMHSGLQPDRVSFALWLNQCCCATFNINWDRSAFEAASACSTSDWMRTIHVFHQMASMQVRLDVANGNTALNSCEKAAAWITGLALLQHLPQAATSADAVTFNSAVSACRGRLNLRERCDVTSFSRLVFPVLQSS